MFSNQSSVYSTKLQSRCLVAHESDHGRHRFLVGSAVLREDNEIQLLDFNEDSNIINCTQVFQHPGEVWTLSCSPRDPRILITGASSRGPDCKAVLWRVPEGAGAMSDDIPEAPAPTAMQELGSVSCARPAR